MRRIWGNRRGYAAGRSVLKHGWFVLQRMPVSPARLQEPLTPSLPARVVGLCRADHPEIFIAGYVGYYWPWTLFACPAAVDFWVCGLSRVRIDSFDS